MGSFKMAGKALVQIIGRKFGAKIAGLALASLALAGSAQAAVQVYVTSSGQGTVNEYSNGVLSGQIAASGSTFNDFSRSVELGPGGLLYVDKASGSTIQAYNATTLSPVGAPITLNSNGGSSFGAYSMSFDTAGNMYVGVLSDDSVQKVAAGSTTASNLVGKQSGGLRVPLDSVVIGNNLFVSAFGQGTGTNGSVLKFDATSGAFLGTFIAAGSNGLSGPVGLAVAPDGSLLVDGTDSSNILKFNATTGAFIGTLVAAGVGGLNSPIDMTIDADNGHLYVANKGNDSVLEYDPTTGAFIGVAVASGAGGLSGAAYLAVTGSNAASPVPLPAGAYAGLLTLGLVGAYAATRRKAVPAVIR